MSKIFFHLEMVSHPLKGKIKEYKDWLNNVASSENGRIEELNYIFCDDDYILKINQDFLQHDYYTDIITFPYSTNKTKIKADIYISIDTVKSNAEEFGETFKRELQRVMVHGLLHMLGYNDKTTEQSVLMREKENIYIQSIEI
ncbi:MAG: rRNA maturation RNase YbeY [Saprospiraceae bacterium]